MAVRDEEMDASKCETQLRKLVNADEMRKMSVEVESAVRSSSAQPRRALLFGSLVFPGYGPHNTSR